MDIESDNGIKRNHQVKKSRLLMLTVNVAESSLVMLLFFKYFLRIFRVFSATFVERIFVFESLL